jgi:phosphoheptose isomerase
MNPCRVSSPARAAAGGDEALAQRFREQIEASVRAKQALLDDLDECVAVARVLIQAYRGGHAMFLFGNGGSAADAQHFAAELMVRYERSRPPRAAIALTTDTSILTATGNDLMFEQVFARQIEALGQAGDVALAITTSGRSANVLRALEAANRRGLVTIALTGRDGAAAGTLATVHVNVAEERTALAQEVHTTVLHIWCELIDEALDITPSPDSDRRWQT